MNEIGFLKYLLILSAYYRVLTETGTPRRKPDIKYEVIMLEISIDSNSSVTC